MRKEILEKKEQIEKNITVRDKITKDTIVMIREYCRAQKYFWRQIPLLALKADGRRGFCDAYQRAYYDGYWMVLSSGHYYTIAVDLENGELMDFFSLSTDSMKPAKDEDLIGLIDNINKLDAKKLIDEIKEVISSHDITKRGEEFVLNYQRRYEKIVKDHSLGEFYSRKK